MKSDDDLKDEYDESIPEHLSPEAFRQRVMAYVGEWFAMPRRSMALIVEYDYNHDRVTLCCTRLDDGTYECTSSVTTWSPTEVEPTSNGDPS